MVLSPFDQHKRYKMYFIVTQTTNRTTITSVPLTFTTLSSLLLYFSQSIFHQLWPASWRGAPSQLYSRNKRSQMFTFHSQTLEWLRQFLFSAASRPKHSGSATIGWLVVRALPLPVTAAASNHPFHSVFVVLTVVPVCVISVVFSLFQLFTVLFVFCWI